VDVFHQHLARALRHTTVDLAMQQHGVENGADIIHHAVTHDVDHSGFSVDPLRRRDSRSENSAPAPCKRQSRTARLH
jgi:hypothetical protein